MEFPIILASVIGIIILTGYYKFIVKVNRLFKLDDAKSNKTKKNYAIIINGVMPVLGMCVLSFLEEDFEFFDWNYIHSINLWLLISLGSFFISFFSMEKVGPLNLLFLAIVMICGIILLIAMLIHISPLLLIGLFPPFLIFAFPAFAIVPAIILIIKQLESHYLFILKE